MGRTRRLTPPPADAPWEQQRDWIERELERVQSRKARGRMTGADRQLAELDEELGRTLAERNASDDRSLAERANEYVIVRDDAGNGIGIAPRSS